MIMCLPVRVSISIRAPIVKSERKLVFFDIFCGSTGSSPVGWLVGVVFGIQIRGAERNTPIEYNQVVAECAKIKKIHVECK